MSSTAVRSEKVDTRRVLLAGDLGCENGTDPGVRRRELARVLAVVVGRLRLAGG